MVRLIESWVVARTLELKKREVLSREISSVRLTGMKAKEKYTRVTV